MKQAMYRVSAEHLWGDKEGEKRTNQLAALEMVGLSEVDGAVYCNAEQALRLILAGYADDYTGARMREHVALVAEIEAGPDVQQLFGIMADKIASAPAASFNDRCQQHQPNAALLAIAETKLLQDSCTDVLQENLANGWRIIAVQPQPDQRRPDYILGRPLMSAMR